MTTRWLELLVLSVEKADVALFQGGVQSFHVDGMHIHKPKRCGSHLKIKAWI